MSRIACVILLLLPGLLTAGDLSGRWQASIDIPSWQIADARTALDFREHADAVWIGRSPRLASFRALGFWRGLLGALARRELRRGAWLTLSVRENPAGIFESRIASAFLPHLDGQCRLHAELLDCEYRRQTRIFATLRARRSAEAGSHPDVALAERIESTLRAHYHRPAALEDAQWQAPLRLLARRMRRARDDLDVLATWQMLSQRFPDSHLALLRHPGGPAAADTDEAFSLRWQKSVAVLRVRNWSATPERSAAHLRQAFEQIEARRATALVIDLRGNGGGNLSAILLAAHLLPERSAVGYFTTRHWWSTNPRAPTPATAALRLPEFRSLDLVALQRALADGPGVYGWVEPRTPRFERPVYLLQDRRTASANEPVLALLQHTGRATLVGETSAGAMLSSEAFEVAPGWQLRVPVADFHTPAGVRLEGRGVRPDVAVTSAKALERALELAGVRPTAVVAQD